MNNSPSMEKIEYFLRSVFDYLDRYTQFTDRPMADERHWIGKDAPVVHLIFLDDVVALKPVLANYVTLFVTGQVFRVEQYVDACVKVIQALNEEDLPDVVIEYVNKLVHVYAQIVHQNVSSATEHVETLITKPEEDPSKPELDYETSIEVKSALGEEEKPPGEQPLEDSVRNGSDRNHKVLKPLEKPDWKSGAGEETVRKEEPNGWR